MKAGAVRKLSGAELRAMREQRAAADPKAEAWAKEASFLRCLATAQEDFDWIVANEAWTLLGHDTFADWWDARAPRMRELGFEPTRQIALAVLARIRSDEEKLPKPQQRTNKQLAASVGLSESSVRRTATRSLPAPADADADLEETSSASAAEANTGRTAGEPDVDLKAASTSGTQTPVDGPDMTPTGEAAASASSPAGAEIAPAPVGAADSPAAESIEPSHAGVPAAGHQTEERTEDAELIGCPLCTYAVEVSEVDPDATLSEMNYHLGRTHDLAGKAAGDALGRVRTISPAADPMAPPSPQQPGQDSPTDHDREDSAALAESSTAVGRSETSLHLPHGGVGGVAPGEPRPPVEPELEGGGILPPSSSSAPLSFEFDGADPFLVVEFFAFVEDCLDRIDVDVIAPLLLDEHIKKAHQVADQMARIAGLLEHWRTQ